VSGMFGRYELVRRLAGGGMGEVFAAKMRGAEGFTKPVALKRIYPHLAGDPVHRQLFVREAKIVAQLSHPNIVQVIELGIEGDELFMAMEFVHGVSLSQLLSRLGKRQQTLPIELVVALAVDLLEALAYAHDYADTNLKITGIVHADVSPANVMVTMQGRAKLCDFGVAKLLHASSTEATRRERWGKAAYMAPEQLTGTRVDARSDLYAIAIMMFEALAGERPFRGAANDLPKSIVLGKRPALSDVAPAVPVEIAAIVEKGAAVDADARFQSAEDMRRALVDAMGTQNLDEARRRLQEIVRAEAGPGFAGDEPRTQVSGQPTSASHDETLARTSLPPVHHPRRGRRLLALAVLCVLIAATYAGFEMTRRRAFDDNTTFVASQPKLTLEEPSAPVVVTTDSAAETPAPLAAGADTIGGATTPHKPRPQRVSRNETATKAGPPALLTLNSAPWAYVTIDGKRLSKPTPLFDYQLTPGSHVVELQGANGKTSRLSLQVRSGEVVRRVVKLE
jgi:serine/threonine protein kinase